MKYYIGLDAHSTTSTFAVVDENGQCVLRETVKTSEQSLVHVINKINGERHMTLEESSISQWLYIHLKDKVDKLIICNPTYIAIQEALDVAKRNRARIVMYRLIKGETASQEIGRLLPKFGFKKKNERIEFKKSVSELPNDEGSPLKWHTAKELNLNPERIAKILKQVSMGDPDTDPTDDPLQFIQDFLADPVLTSGLECIHVGFFQEEVAALTVVQRNPKTGWSRISYMGVVPRFRKQSLGNWVHRYSFAVMKKEGGLLYHGGTTSTNLGMIRLFESNGCARFCEMEEWNFSMGREVSV